MSSIWLLPAVSAVQLAPVLALPHLPALAASCTVPTLLGYVKSEWGVSYAYGGATALVGALTLPHATTAAVAATAEGACWRRRVRGDSSMKERSK